MNRCRCDDVNLGFMVEFRIFFDVLTIIKLSKIIKILIKYKD